jgi:exopolysaccharide biosynthesis polyprenyl glycosylphosphotransferase
LADVACSVCAFIVSYATLPWLRDAVGKALEQHPELPITVLPPLPGSLPLSWARLAWIGIIVTLASALVLEYSADSKPLDTQRVRDVLVRQAISMLTALGSVATVFYALRTPPSSRLFVVEYVAFFFAFTSTYRLVTRGVQLQRRRAGVTSPSTLLAGTRDGVRRYMGLAAKTSGAASARISGCVIVDNDPTPPAPGCAVLGRIRDIGELLIHNPIDEVIVILPDGAAAWLPTVIRHCDYFRVALQVVDERLMDIGLRDLKQLNASDPAPSVRLIPEEELTTPTLVWKRIMDVVLSFTGLVALLPLFGLIAIGIKITTPKLPVFYSWNWVGYRGRRFRGHKFTTMVADADARKDDLAAKNEMSGPVFKIKKDPRVTPFGRFLRKYSLNELPQLWSVLVGDMSLVGPRPALPRELVRYEMWHKRKLSVQPGITCFWQVRGRNEISDFDDWVRMDLEYIQKRSLWTDLTILLQTIPAVLRGTGS